MIFRTHVGHENGTASEEAVVDRWVMLCILAACAAKSNTPSLTRNCLGRLGTTNVRVVIDAPHALRPHVVKH